MGRATFLESFAPELDGDAIVQHCAVQHAPEVYSRYLADAEGRVWIAETERGAPVGYVVSSRPDLPIEDPSPADVEIKRIYLLSRFQGAGAGKAMLHMALDDARRRRKSRALLGVYGGNHQAIAFYRSQGFEIVGERRFQVGPREYLDAVMGRPL